MKSTCSNCKYWELIDSINGTCHRYAPKPTVVKGQEKDKYILILPVTKKDDWCGDFIAEEVVDFKVQRKAANA